MSYRYKRYISYIIITFFVMIMPFITINGNHLLLLSFDKMVFHFLGLSFNMDELYIMPFLLMSMFLFIFAITSIKGRIWCGWACPQTIFRTIYRDLIESTILDLRKIKNKQKDIKYNKLSKYLKKYLSLIIWFILCLIISLNFLLYFIASEDLFSYIQNPNDHKLLYSFILGIAAFLFYDIVFLKENFCTYLCPYAMMQSALFDKNTTQALYNYNRGGKIYKKAEKTIFNIKDFEESSSECTTCEACVKICPANIDIRKGLQIECINCLECVDACTTVMGKLDKKSLVIWNSPNETFNNIYTKLFNKKSVMYMITISLALILAFVTAQKKEPFILHINKTTSLYNIKGEIVSNNYILSFHNRLDKRYTYKIRIDNKDFSIKRLKEISLEPNKRRKTVFIVQAKKRLFLSDAKDTAIKLNITAFIKEDESIKIHKVISFIYPRNSLFR
ncbi:MAG: cytochrome c oxidase accessory protein CcoG [Campylobacteraceae bacterium]|nr:cytochrome c oxidase accessory protein CcoG [Campylobacteraceae bacterium]